MKTPLMYYIRRMKVSDINTVLDIQNRNITESAIPIIYLRDLYISDLHYVCLQGDTIVGFVSCTLSGDIINCNTLCVDFPHTRRNIGKSLLDCIKEEGRTVSIHVRADNKGAKEFYKKQGFRVVKEGVPYYYNGEEGIIMEYREK